MQAMPQTPLTSKQLELINANLDMPDRVVRTVVKSGDVEEAGSIAQMALVDAAQKFEDQCEFGAFAFNAIRWKLLDWMRSQNGHARLDQAVAADGEGATLGEMLADRKTFRPDVLAEQNEQKGQVLKTLRQHGSIRLAEVRERTPAPTGLGDYYHKMRETICESVTQGDVKDIMTSLVQRAKQGDVQAAKLVLAQVAGPSAPRITQTVEVKQVTLADFEESES